MENNPFAALFPSPGQAQQFSLSNISQSAEAQGGKVKHDEKPTPAPATDEQNEANSTIENIFLITLNKEPGGKVRPAQMVYLEEVSTSLKETQLDLGNLDQAVFERLMLDSPRKSVIKTSGSHKAPRYQSSEPGEPEHLRYLYNCYRRYQEEERKHKGKVIDQCRAVILSNSRMCLQHPDFFNDLDTAEQFVGIFTNDENTHMFPFFEEVATEVYNNSDEGSVLDCFRPALDKMKSTLEKGSSLGHSSVFTMTDLLMFFTRKSFLAEALLAHCTPQNVGMGAQYESTVLGHVLAISCMKKNDSPPFDFFDNPSKSTKPEIEMAESRIHTASKGLNEAVFQIVYSILRLGGQPRNLMLSWIGNCLHANIGRAKMWSTQLPGVFNVMHASDGFFMNLLAVLLRLCKPFADPKSPKLLKVQPSYCLATKGDETQLQERNVHAKGLHDQTFFIPQPDDISDIVVPEASYNFITECFFMTHQCMHLGMHVLIEKFMKRNQDLHQVERLHREINQQGGQDSEAGQRILERLDRGMTLYLSMKAALAEPTLLDLCFDFIIATSSYLSHVGTSSDLTTFTDITFPLPTGARPALTALPEFIMENMVDVMLFVRRFKDHMYECQGPKLTHLMTMILVYMGSPDRVKNPHLRARLAEALDALMPAEHGANTSLVSNFHREQLFVTHPLVAHISETLLNVFVSIEMTGESVEFEAKFNYRRPMYAILKYMWTVDEHRQALQDLATYAEEHIEDTNPPLFLRFINLLINDTIFLLDEALSFMSQIKEKQAEKESEAWSALTPQQRQEKDNQLRILGMQARFHNIMGNSTICSLELLTQRIHSIFTHQVMVDRISAMLNYSLLHLVGPKSKSLKVKDFDEYEFKPQELLSTICQIYVNLGKNDRFCLGVASDGRSYSKELFVEVHKVLQRIGSRPDVIVEFSELSSKVEVLAARQNAEDEAVENAPEEFLDPIMGTLMRDPVLLPSSGNIVDRATIARHILSDQTDPFNRSPLSMDMVKPDNILKARIDSWLEEVHKDKLSLT